MANATMDLDATLADATQSLWRGELGARSRSPAGLPSSGADLPWPLPPDLGAADLDQPALSEERPRYRAIFISDLHLGTPGCQAGPLLEFLKTHESESLYLIGDIIDGW